MEVFTNNNFNIAVIARRNGFRFDKWLELISKVVVDEFFYTFNSEFRSVFSVLSVIFEVYDGD